MPTQAELDRYVWLEAQRYLSSSYAELAELAHRSEGEFREWRSCCGEEVGLAVLIGEWGLFRKRVSVELILSAGEKGQSLVSIVYFERFRSGKMRGPWPKRNENEEQAR
jgi:hypothetical protein